MEQLQRAEQPYRFRIPEDRLPKMRDVRARQQESWRDLIEAEEVIHLYLGLGPARFLTFDGRVLVDNYDWDGTGAYEVSEPKKACVAVVHAAASLGFPDLLRVLPERPAHAVDCPRCGGSGWLCRSANGRSGVVCEEHCGGLGWLPGANAEPGDVVTQKSPREL